MGKEADAIDGSALFARKARSVVAVLLALRPLGTCAITREHAPGARLTKHPGGHTAGPTGVEPTEMEAG